MRRTNIYLHEDQLQLLKHLAVEEGSSFTDLVRRALVEFLESRGQASARPLSKLEWNRRLKQLLARVRKRTKPFRAREIEADISAASREVRRRRPYAARRR